MKQGNKAIAEVEALDRDDVQETSVREMLETIQEQGRTTLELVRSLIGLLLPKEGGRDGPSLEELLATILVQQRETLALAKIHQGELARLGETLPVAVAEAVGDRAGGRSAHL